MPIDRNMIARIEPPDGWAWHRRPTPTHFGDYDQGMLRYTGPNTLREYGAKLEGMCQWAVEANFMAQPYVHGNIEGRTVYNSVAIIPVDTALGYRRQQLIWEGWNTRTNRNNPLAICACGEVHPPTILYCEATDTPLLCEVDGCLAVHGRGRFHEGVFYCNNHLQRCAYHNEFIAGQTCNQWVVRDGHSTFCPEHSNMRECPGCREEYEQAYMADFGDGFYVCQDCVGWTCVACHTIDHDGNMRRNDGGQLLCDTCYIAWENGRKEEYDPENDNLAPEALKIAAAPQRPIRVCSIEMETVQGGSRLARELYEAGLTPFDEILRYHYPVDRDIFCHVEADSSLGRGGGELIFHRMRLDDDEELEKLHQAIGIVRNLIKAGELGMDTRCGLHMHVDAHQFGVGHVRNLVLIFNYLEDVLYRMGGAKYGVGHRGYQYANKLLKGDYETRQKFGAFFFGANGHTHALNVGNYWQAMQQRCQCGAATVGMHEKCVCNLGKCTFEFRIWNGSANIRKIRAYAALCQSLVAFARNMPDLNDRDFPPMEYLNNAPIEGEGVSKTVERLTWMFKNLYFTPDEKQDVLYLAKNCTLATIGENTLDDIALVEYESPQPEELAVPVYYGARKNPQPAENDGQRRPQFIDEWTPGFMEEEGIELDYDDDDNDF